MQKAKKLFSVILSSLITVSFVLAFPCVSYAAGAIAGNGTGGISININASPYTDYAKKSYGEYAYGPSGCAWFASARVCQLTGKNTNILSGQSWYNSGYSTYGFSRGQSIQSKALACYSGHVAVVEAVNGNTVTVSEGGMPSYPNNGYCVIRTTTISQLQNRSSCGTFLGYVYLGTGGSTPSPATGNNPIGYLDCVSSPSPGKIRVTGWALDLDSPSKSIDVHIYVGGTAGTSGAEGHAITANAVRADVGSAYSKYGAGNYHGFDVTFSTSKTGSQAVYAYGINVGGGNTNPVLTNSPKTVKILPVYNPQGYLDSADSPSPGKLHVCGWAFDKDDTSTALTVHIYVGGPAGSGAPCYAIKANKERTDVNKVFAGAGNNHGYDETINVSKSGSQKIYAYALNIGGGNTNPNLTNSPKTVNILPDKENPKITNITVSQVSLKGYRVTCNVSDNVAVQTVKFPSWTTKTDEKGNNQDDLIWHVGKIDGNQASFYVKTSDHNNEIGAYLTHIYAYDVAGNVTWVKAGTITVTDTPSEVASTTYSGNRYTVYNSGMNWKEAKDWCESKGGHLATISDEQEWNTVKCTLEKFNGVNCWLGAEKTNGIWKWVDDTKFAYKNWGKNQPDNSGGIERYLGTWGGGYINSYSWNDYINAPDDIGGFVCEFEKESSETTEPVDTQPVSVEPTEPIETQPVSVEPTEPIETQPVTVEPTEPIGTQPATNEPTEPVVTQPVTEKPASPAVTPTVKKKANPIKVTAKKSVKAKSKKKTTIKKAIIVKKAKGKVTYKTNNKKVTVKSGNLIISKGLKKGKTYKVKITITAKGNSNFKSKKIAKTIKIKVK